MYEEILGLTRPGGYRVRGADRQVVPGTGQAAAREWLAAFNATRARNPSSCFRTATRTSPG
jgi:hypothetical protein